MYYEAADGSVPADAYLSACPAKIAAGLLAVLAAVRESPPPKFSGGGQWEAMHGTMGGYFEIRKKGPGKLHYRLFCVLDNGSAEELKQRGFRQPQIAVLNGLTKPNGETFSDAEYKKHVRELGDRYRATLPRPIAT